MTSSCPMARIVYHDNDSPRQIRLSEIVAFDELEHLIGSPHVLDYGEYHNGQSVSRQRNIASAFVYLKRFSLTDEGANAIIDAEQA